MYNRYYNFDLIRRKNFVELKAEAECVLEKEKDDFYMERKECECLLGPVFKKFSTMKYDSYHICTYKVSQPNIVTNYKKIWGLGNFEKEGLFDDYYDISSGRVYLGIYEGTPHCDQETFSRRISLYVPKGKTIDMKKIFSIIQANSLDINDSKIVVQNILSQLSLSLKEIVIVHSFSNESSVCVFGERVDSMFSQADLPENEVIEKI